MRNWLAFFFCVLSTPVFMSACERDRVPQLMILPDTARRILRERNEPITLPRLIASTVDQTIREEHLDPDTAVVSVHLPDPHNPRAHLFVTRFIPPTDLTAPKYDALMRWFSDEIRPHLREIPPRPVPEARAHPEMRSWPAPALARRRQNHQRLWAGMCSSLRSFLSSLLSFDMYYLG